MKDLPAWLPSMISTDGEWAKIVALLYGIFEKDFKETRRLFEERPIRWDRRILAGDQYEEGFWHLISTTDPKTRKRNWDPRRGERIPWSGPTISNSRDPAVRVWDYLEGKGRVRTYLWLEDWDYVIILEKKKARTGNIAFLVTAFHVAGDSNRKSLRTKFTKRIKP